MLDLLRRPTAFLPLAISLAFLLPLLVGAAQRTLVRFPDEGAAAHLFQVLMPLQLIVIIWFGLSWLPKRPWPAVSILCLQGLAFLTVVGIVHSYNL